MDVIYSLIPGMMFFGLIFLAVLIWAVKKGQYEDMEGNASRILFDDDTMIYPDKTTSHSTRLSKDDSQVAGYSRAMCTVSVVRSLPPCLTFEMKPE